MDYSLRPTSDHNVAHGIKHVDIPILVVVLSAFTMHSLAYPATLVCTLWSSFAIKRTFLSLQHGQGRCPEITSL